MFVVLCVNSLVKSYSLCACVHIQMADKEPNNPAKGHTVVAFLIFPTRHNSFNVDSLKGQAITKQLRYIYTYVVST